jgi:hypothetical protein
MCKQMVQRLDQYGSGYVNVRELRSSWAAPAEAAILRAICKAVSAVFAGQRRPAVLPDLSRTTKYDDELAASLLAASAKNVERIRAYTCDEGGRDGASSDDQPEAKHQTENPSWASVHSKLAAVDAQSLRVRLDCLGREFGFDDPAAFDTLQSSGLEAFAAKTTDQSLQTWLRTMPETLEWSHKLCIMQENIAVLRTRVKEVLAKVSVVQCVYKEDGKVAFEAAAKSVSSFIRRVDIASLQKIADELRGWLLGSARQSKRVGGGYSLDSANSEVHARKVRETSQSLPDAARVAIADWKDSEHDTRAVAEPERCFNRDMVTMVTAKGSLKEAAREKKEKSSGMLRRQRHAKRPAAAGTASGSPQHRRSFAATALLTSPPPLSVISRSPLWRRQSSATIVPAEFATGTSYSPKKRARSRSVPRTRSKSQSPRTQSPSKHRLPFLVHPRTARVLEPGDLYVPPWWLSS